MKTIPVVISLFFAGCAGQMTEGVKATSKEALHAQSGGMAVTIWKVPVIGVGLWGLLSGPAEPPLVIHQYNYQAVPPQPQTGAAVKPGPPQPVPYQTEYQTAPRDDPTLAIFTNVSDRATFEIVIDGKAPIVLPPRAVSADIYLDVGDHTVKVRGTIPTHFGPRPIPEYIRSLRVEARGRYQPIYLSE